MWLINEIISTNSRCCDLLVDQLNNPPNCASGSSSTSEGSDEATEITSVGESQPPRTMFSSKLMQEICEPGSMRTRLTHCQAEPLLKAEAQHASLSLVQE